MLFLFLRLVLAHLIADFPLQTNTIYKLKIEGLWGQILHSEIIFLTCVVFVFPYLHIPSIWAFLFLVTFLHMVQDYVKVTYFKQSKYPFIPFFIDQMLHLTTIAMIFLFPLKDIKPFVDLPNIFFRLYNDNLLMCFLIGYILVSWHGIYFIDTFKKTFLKDERFFKDTMVGYLVPKEEKYYGIMERIAFTTLAFFGGWFYVFIPIVGSFRFLFKNLRFLSISLLGMFLSIVVGTILRILSF